MGLQPSGKCAILEIDKRPIVRLEVGGRFLGTVNVLTGEIALYHRGKRSWVSIAEERERLGIDIDD
jgi:hypothetical protein